MPRRMRSRRTGSELQAGPIVQLIFARRSARRSARRMSDAAGDASTGAPVTFRVVFPFFKFVPTRIYVGLIIVYGELLFSRHDAHSKAMISAPKVGAGIGPRCCSNRLNAADPTPLCTARTCCSAWRDRDESRPSSGG